MRLDAILTRDDCPDIALEVQGMRRPRSIVATGVAQSGGFTSQFRVQLDEPRGRWTVDYDKSEGTTSSDRTLHSADSADSADSAFAEEAFPSGTPEEVRMLMPDRFGELPPPAFEPITDWIRAEY